MQVDLNFKRILITGGTGSLGKIIIKHLLIDFPDINKLIIFSRDEYKQTKMSRKFNHSAVEFVIGDVRDSERLNEVLKDVDVVIHAAAMKCLDICEKNPSETYKTNVEGTFNIIEAAKINNVKKVLFISTDKAVEPISVYGSSKAIAEQKILEASKQLNPAFNIIRLGNIFKSRGSVFTVFKDLSKKGSLTVFDKNSTRYLIKGKQLYNSIIYSLSDSLNGIVVIPKLKSFKVTDLAKAYCSSCEITEKPLRQGERVHEFLFSSKELESCYEDEHYFYIIHDEKVLSHLNKKNIKLFKTPITQPLSSETGNFFHLSELRMMISNNYLEV